MSEPTIDTRALGRAADALLAAAGAHGTVARDVTDALIATSLRGIDSHGIALLPRILARAEAGRSQLSRPAETVRDADPGIAQLDAHLTPGQHACMAAARIAAKKAGEAGLALVTVRESTHFGAAAPYLLHLLENGLVGLVGSNATPSMAAFGATFANLGNNPFGFAAPVEGGPDLLFDFSSGVMSFGRLGKLRSTGAPVPEDAFIRPSDAPAEGPVYEIAGALEYVARPFGDYKGAAVAVMIEVLSGLLSGGNFGTKTEVMEGERFRGPSHFVLAIDPQRFGVPDLPGRMAEYAAGIRQDRATIRLPGDAAGEVEKARRECGIPFPEALREEFIQLSQKLGADAARHLT